MNALVEVFIIQIKIVLLGDGSVGKTSLRRTFVSKELKFNEQYLATLGADFSLKTLNIDLNKKKYSVKFSIWDLAGQPIFDKFRLKFYNGVEAAFFIYDITNRKSFDNITSWVSDLDKYIDVETIPTILIANKIDLRNENPESINTEEGKILQDQINEKFLNNEGKINFIETSAKVGTNVDKAFESIAIDSVKIKENAIDK